MGFGFAVREGPTEGHGAFTEVTHWLPWNTLAPSVDIFRISKPVVADGWSMATCTAGFPVIKFPRNVFPWTPAAINIPFVFPRTVLFSMMLPVFVAVTNPIPKLFPCAA